MLRIEIPLDQPDICKIVGDAILSIHACIADSEKIADNDSDESGPVQEKTELVKNTGVDALGVPFNIDYSAGGFYKSGERKGQWKKLPAVNFADYDEWHNASRPAPEKEQEPNVELTVGGLFSVMSEKLAAQEITQADIDAAYEKTNVSQADLFSPASQEALQADLLAIHKALGLV